MACCCLSEAEREQRKISKAIDKELKKDRKLALQEKKVLLLGAGGSGKSTIAKQMRIIHGQGYTEADRVGFKKLVFLNVYSAMRALLDGMDVLNIKFTDEWNEAKAKTIRQTEPNTVKTLLPEHLAVLKSLWADGGMQACYDRQTEFQLSDSAKYFLDDLDRIGGADYKPTEQDVLRVHVPTTGIIEYGTFNLCNTVVRQFQIWENVDCIIFVVDLSGYDQVLVPGHPEESRMEESKALFRNLILYPWVQTSTWILVLNKKDLLEEKIKASHLQTYFPDFPGPDNDAIAAREFILKMFAELNPDPEKEIYLHFTCATDTENIQAVFHSAKYQILNLHFGCGLKLV